MRSEFIEKWRRSSNPNIDCSDCRVELQLQSSLLTLAFEQTYANRHDDGPMVDPPAAATELGNREFFIRRYEHEFPVFVDVFRALPANRLDYRPHPSSRSAGELVALLVIASENCAGLCSTGQASFASGLSLHSTIKVGPLDEMIAAYEKHHHALMGALSHLTDATWNRPAWLMQGKQEIVLKNTVGGLLWIALFDSVHHRGQLSTYIRPMGGKVPSIYGPSADAPAR